ncbi:uncharacterized protein LOC116339184 isoform X2 [Contarinia nasturtii]|uniref:uncharacterized protein LOC116339184 isoform X2 n=1 Tax=Contarinia nasturtii TaxID=265458 RepID=UPI0012D43868|nr:uncharacterized protein LOC116339184 isoform X2 [Contarinia nasturtii]
MTEKPPIKLLSAAELIEKVNLYETIEADILIRGLKASFPKNTDEERAAIKSYQDDLRKVLSMERIAIRHERSTAVIEYGKIRLTKKQGRWDIFQSSGQYLEPHLALFLIEINRLEVYLGKVIVSLERAYHMFLAHDNNSEHDRKENDKLTQSEYIIFAHFMRFGCNIRRFKNECVTVSSESKSNANDATQSDADIEKLYVWNYLYELLGHNKSVITSKSLDTNRYNAVKNSMNATIEKIKNPNDGDDDVESSKTNVNSVAETGDKRKIDCKTGEPASKLNRIDHKRNTVEQYFGSGSTNDFMVGNTFQRFKQIFDQIDYIKVKQPESFVDQKPINEKISFDLWASCDHREPQLKGPDFRLIVLQPSKSLPHNDDIFRLYNSLVHKSAIVLSTLPPPRAPKTKT